MTAYRFGRFELVPDSHQLLVDGKAAPVGARALDLLRTLIEARDRVVSKEELLERAWPGVIVEENNLQVQVSALRKLLGASAIATVPGRGYRFAVESVPAAADASSQAQARAHDLPRALGALLGRERDLAQVRSLCEAHRFVTVTGSGGVGKTRLAVEVAAIIGARYAGGAWFVDLAPLGDPALVAEAVTTALRISVTGSLPPLDALIKTLRDEELILVVDNCEHLIDAVASLLESLLTAAPKVRTLATSREPIGITGEQVFRLPSLTVPDASARSPEAALACGAVQLFVERARAADPAFVLDEAGVPVVTAICSRLDGIPLALEMAAARVPMLGLAALAERLDERFRILTVGKRTALPRQRTLHATLEWSFGLLTPQERTVFRRLAVFAGPFTLEAAVAVAAADELDDFAVVDLVASLCAKSLVSAETDSDRIRYWLLESARAYGQERLAEAGETLAATRRHAAHMRAVFASCLDDWTRLPERDFIARYAPQLDNLRLALESSFSADGDAETGIALAGASGPLWVTLSLNREGERWLQAAQAAMTPATPQPQEAEVWLSIAANHSSRDVHRSAEASRRAASLYRSLGDSLREGCALHFLVMALAATLDEEAGTVYDVARPLLMGSRRPRLTAMAEQAQSYRLGTRSAFPQAIESIERSIELWRIAGVETQVLRMRSNLANQYWAGGDLDRAIASARESRDSFRASRFTGHLQLAYLRANLFGMLTERGDLAEARMLGGEVMKDLRDFGIAIGWMDHYALFAAKLGDAATGARLVGWADAVRAAKPLPRQVNEVRARESAFALLQSALPSGELARLLAEGAALREDEACDLTRSGTPP